MVLTNAQHALRWARDIGFSVTTGGVLLLGEKPYKPESKDGYYGFRTVWDNKRVWVKVHRLQAYQLFGDKIFEPGVVVRHLDSDTKNNSLSNIAIGTYKDNHMDRPDPEGFMKEQGAKSAAKARKIPEDMEATIWEHYKQTGSKRATSRHFAKVLGCHKSTVYQYLSKITYKSISKYF